MRGAISPLPNKPSWCGAQLKHRDSLTFCLTINSTNTAAVRTSKVAKYRSFLKLTVITDLRKLYNMAASQNLNLAFRLIGVNNGPLKLGP
jgi:hypothetical protein